MKEPRKNKIPLPKTIARHFSEGKYCDYPLEIIMSAINSHNLEYNSIAIPIRLGFWQTLIVNFDAYLYLIEHNSETELQQFVTQPNQIMANVGIELPVEFDRQSAELFAIFAEPELVEAMKSEDELDFHKVLWSDAWKQRHPQKYSEGYMSSDVFIGVNDLNYSLHDIPIEKIGMKKPDRFGVCLMSFCMTMSEKGD